MVPEYKGRILLSLGALGELNAVINCEKKSVTYGEGRDSVVIKAEEERNSSRGVAHQAKVELHLWRDLEQRRKHTF